MYKTLLAFLTGHAMRALLGEKQRPSYVITVSKIRDVIKTKVFFSFYVGGERRNQEGQNINRLKSQVYPWNM